EKSLNDSAQSPACSKNARPAATSPRAAVSARASPAKTSGGSAASSSRTPPTRPGSGQSRWWRARPVGQDDGGHGGAVVMSARLAFYGLEDAAAGPHPRDPSVGVAQDTDPLALPEIVDGEQLVLACELDGRGRRRRHRRRLRRGEPALGDVPELESAV